MNYKKSLFLSSLVALVIFFSFPTFVSAATWYISTTGTDASGYGTSTGASAWRTLDYALTGSRVAKGDLIEMEAGTYSVYNGAHTAITPAINTASGTGAVIVEAYPAGASVTIDEPNAAVSVYLSLSGAAATDITFKHINFTNSLSKTAGYFRLYAPNSLTFEDCNLDASNASGNKLVTFLGGTGSSTLIVKRSILRNTGGTDVAIVNTLTSGANVSIESSIVYDYTALASISTTTNLSITNSTLVGLNYPSYTRAVYVLATSSTITLRNNIFYMDSDPAYGVIQFGNPVAGYLYAINNPSQYQITNNIWYNPHASPYGTTFPIFSSYQGVSTNHVFNIDGSNHFMDPLLVSTSTKDFHLSSSSPACGHGVLAALPVSDKNGEGWFGKDVGAYKCFSDNSQVSLQNKVAFAGDSIMNTVSSPANYFSTITGIPASDPSLVAWSGGTMERTYNTIDGLMASSSPPNTVFLAVGVNNLANRYPDTVPTYPTSQEYANYIVSIMSKIEHWGARPVWLGIGTMNYLGAAPDTGVHSINNAVEATCLSRGWSCGSYLNQMMLNPLWQSAAPNGYYDIVENVHPNIDGKNLIASTAAYLYYPKYSATNTPPQYSGNIKIYKSGLYRYSTATSSSDVADFSVSPVGGYSSNNYQDYLDVVINTWDKTGDQNKSWTASSTAATSTTYTIGDLVPNVNYTFKLDSLASTTAVSNNSQCTNGVCMSDETGHVSFTYTGGYSTHTFELEKVADVVPEPEPTPATHRSSGNSVQNQIENLLAMGNTKLADELKVKYNIASSSLNSPALSTPNSSSTPTFKFTRDLKLGTKHAEVKLLQQFLNTQGFLVDLTGAGSPGQETSLFGKLTQQALIKFQQANKITPAVGYFGPVTRKVILKLL
jgi:hypothetical protein